jgi:hypothetical protein
MKLPDFYLSLASRMISIISWVEIFALIDGTSSGEETTFSGTIAKVRPSFLRINTFPVFSDCSSTMASFCRASEYVYTCILHLQCFNVEFLGHSF